MEICFCGCCSCQTNTASLLLIMFVCYFCVCVYIYLKWNHWSETRIEYDLPIFGTSTYVESFVFLSYSLSLFFFLLEHVCYLFSLITYVGQFQQTDDVMRSVDATDIHHHPL